MGNVQGEQEQPDKSTEPVPPARLGQRDVPSPVLYLVLFVLGALQGLIGSFQYSQAPVPLIAILLALIIFATCLGGGWGMRTFGGGLIPALGWLAASFILASPRGNGSVIVTASTAGTWYLYGGALACLAGSVGSMIFRAARLR